MSSGSCGTLRAVMPEKATPPETRDYLLRGLPITLADKLKVASSLHRSTMKDYMLEILRKHIEELERKGVVLTLTEAKKRT